MEALLTPRSDESPSGENLEYEPVFSALELAATPGEEKQVGEDIVAGDPPDYADVISKAHEVLEQSHDLRAAVHLAVAELHVNGFPGLARATGYIRGCLESFWDSCHPQLDEEDDDDPTMRVNSVVGLSDDTMLVRPVRKAPLAKSQAFGLVSLRDIEVAKGEISADPEAERVLDEAGIAAAFQDTDAELLSATFDGASSAFEDIKAIDAVFNDKTPGQGPDLSAIMKMLQRAVNVLAEATGSDAQEADGEEAGTEGGAAPAAAPLSGAITSPRDVEAALDKIMAYYAAQEPSSPVPTILARAKRLVGADFMTIMQDMAPDGISNVKLVGGISDE